MRRFSSDQYRFLAPDLAVSPLGLGTVKLGRNTDVKYPASFTLPDDNTVRQLLSCAQEAGINFIDTAPAYGQSEERLGQLLDNRHDWIVSTKVGEIYENQQSRFDFSTSTTLASVDRSLTRLRTDYLDVILVHADDNDVDVIRQTDVIETLLRLKEAGKVRAVGVSTKTVQGGRLALALCDTVMVAYNVDDTSQGAVIEKAQAQGKSVIVKKALASGHAGEPADALRFALTPPAVASVVVGTISPAHLEDNINAVAG